MVMIDITTFDINRRMFIPVYRYFEVLPSGKIISNVVITQYKYTKLDDPDMVNDHVSLAIGLFVGLLLIYFDVKET